MRNGHQKQFHPSCLSDALLEKIHWWVPPVSSCKPLSEQPATPLRVAAMVDERLFRGFRFEAELLLLTPANWRRILAEEEIDFLLVESCWQTVTGHWYLGQCFDGSHTEELVAIVDEAGKHAIPTVYWNTWDHLYHSFFSDFARKFDLVFCADPVEVELLRKEGTKAHFLPPAIQPVLHNSRKTLLPGQKELSINVLFDGFTDIDRLGDQLSVLEEVRPYGLHIVESQAQVFTTRIKKTAPLLQECFLGSLSYNDWLTTVQHSHVALFMGKTQRTKTQQQWQTLESAACGAAVLHFGKLDESDIRHPITASFTDETDLLLMLECFFQDDLYRQRTAEEQQETICRHHIFQNRLGVVCASLGIKQPEVQHRSIQYLDEGSNTVVDSKFFKTPATLPHLVP